MIMALISSLTVTPGFQVDEHARFSAAPCFSDTGILTLIDLTVPLPIALLSGWRSSVCQRRRFDAINGGLGGQCLIAVKL